MAEGGGQAMATTHQEDLVMEQWQDLTKGDFSGAVLLMSPSSLLEGLAQLVKITLFLEHSWVKKKIF